MQNIKQPPSREATSLAEREAFWGTIVASAIRNKAIFARTPEKKHTKVLKKIIRNAELVFGLFEDLDKPNGLGFYLIKGEQSLTKIIQSGNERKLKVEGIHCREVEEAVAMNHVFGDGDEPN